MNANAAIDKATANGVSISVDFVTRIGGKKIRAFRVGGNVVTHVAGNVWRYIDANGAELSARRGDIIALVTDIIVMERAAAK